MLLSPHTSCYLYHTLHATCMTHLALPSHTSHHLYHIPCHLYHMYHTHHATRTTHLILLVQHTPCYLYHHLMITAPHNTCYLYRTLQTVPHTLNLPLTYPSRVPHISRYLYHTINNTCIAHLMPSFHTSRTTSTTWTPCSNTLKCLQGENYWQTS
jgi:hypothetical protein